MKNELQPIHNFLLKNESYNKKFQMKEYKKILFPHESIEEKIIALLYSIVNTQSQPKIDPLSDFFRCIVWKKYDSLKSFKSFVRALTDSDDTSYKTLYENLKNNKGWGKKTSALFTKVIFNIHYKKYDKELVFWDDTPQTLNNDKIFLPVDTVIIEIFNQLGMSNPSFDSINKELHKYYSVEEMAIWDDLWFWGFINQKGSGKDRNIEWNSNKYWALESSDKDPDTLNTIKYKSSVFRQLILGKS
ncbi:hypothetical protein [Halarcobacter ebronensis]|uniref:hypothetical protein n=1 Tax=Halarcobacter ebronensis TaxID=1462615 RepID=UPI003C764254